MLRLLGWSSGEEVKEIQLHAVKSGAISHLGHDGDTMAVKYKSGGIYHFPGVSKEEFDRLRNAKSIGQHMAVHFKKPGTKVS